MTEKQKRLKANINKIRDAFLVEMTVALVLLRVVQILMEGLPQEDEKDAQKPNTGQGGVSCEDGGTPNNSENCA